MSKQKTYDIIDQYLKGELEEEKKKEFENLLKNSADLRIEIDSYRKIKDSLTALKVPDPGNAFFIASAKQIYTAINKKEKTGFSVSNIIRLFKPASALAAAAVISALIIGILWHNSGRRNIEDIQYSLNEIRLYDSEYMNLSDSELEKLELNYTAKILEEENVSIDDTHWSDYKSQDILSDDLEILSEKEFEDFIKIIKES